MVDWPLDPAATGSRGAAKDRPSGVDWPLDRDDARRVTTGRGGPAADRVVVGAGDCLWLIAARRLGSAVHDDEIAAESRRWYAANRRLIGTDPDVLRPGQVLVPPGDPARPQAPP